MAEGPERCPHPVRRLRLARLRWRRRGALLPCLAASGALQARQQSWNRELAGCCPGCGEAMDSFGDHVLSCHQLGICQALCKRAERPRTVSTFQPFAFETVGSFGGSARFLCQRLARQWSLHHECSLQEAGRAVHRALGCAVIRDVARQLERGFPSAEEGPEASALWRPRRPAGAASRRRLRHVQ